MYPFVTNGYKRLNLSCDTVVLYYGSVIVQYVRTVKSRKKQYTWFVPMDELTLKTPNPKCRLFFKIDLLTDFVALCLTDFIEEIHSLIVGIFDPACELLSHPWTKELYLWIVAPPHSL
jgi:hypothetical protein